MPPPDPNFRDRTGFFASLAIGYTVVTYFRPLTHLTTLLTLLLYFYLKQEHLCNSALVSRTPPVPEAHLPATRDEWVANGGLRKLPPLDPASGSDVECCICRDIPNDPTQITLCGHVFCMECLHAWQVQRHRSCPQCTINLWRESPKEWLQLETLVKFVAAEGLIAIPLTVFALGVCFAHYTFYETNRIGTFRVLLLLGFGLLSVLVLALIGSGASIMIQRRRTEGVRWWGGDLDAEQEFAFRMAAYSFSVVAGGWLLLMSLTFETYMWPLVANLDLKIFGCE